MKQRVLVALAAVVVVAAPASGAPLPPGADPGFLTCEPGHLFDFPFSSGEGSFGPVHMALPASGSTNVPRNVEIVLGGFLGDLDLEPPFLVVKLLAPDNEEVPTTRSGALLRPNAPLAPRTTYRLAVRFADEESCPGCEPHNDTPFTTGDALDVTPPSYTSAPLVQAFVLSELDQQCGFAGGFGTTHVLLGRLDSLPGDVARISVAVRAGGGSTTRALDAIVREPTHPLFRSGTEPVALGDDVVVAVTPIDLAGNAGAAVSVRVRARPFDDLREAPFEELDDRQCTLPSGVRAALPETVPTNPRFVVEMPVEPVPMALAFEEGAIPLHPAEHLPWGQVLEPATTLPAGRTLQLVSLPCAHCACVGCDVSAPVSFTVGDGPDEEPPAVPVVLDVLEDLDPPLAEGACHPDRSALIALIEAGDDDHTPAEHLRYDAVLRLEGQLAVEVGRALPVVLDEDGTAAVRLQTAAYGRLLTQPFELVLTATDLAGNRSSTSFAYAGPEAGLGCGSTEVPGGRLPLLSALLLAALGFLGLRRRSLQDCIR